MMLPRTANTETTDPDLASQPHPEKQMLFRMYYETETLADSGPGDK